MKIGSLLDRVAASGARPVSASSVAVFRITFGLLGFVAMARFFLNDWIDALYVEPTFHFKYIGFEWVHPLPGWGMHSLFAMLAILALGVSAGFLYRFCITAFALGFLYVELLDATNYLNHYYWLTLTSMLMVFMPLNRAWSVDARLNRASNHRPPTIPVWTLWALRAQLGVVYFFGGVAKVNADWLFDAMPMKIWLFQHGDYPILGPLFQQAWTAYAMSWAGCIFDLSIVWFCLVRSTRLVAYCVLLGFHLATWQIFPALGMFPWLMMASMLIFFSPVWPESLSHNARALYTRILHGKQSCQATEAVEQLSETPVRSTLRVSGSWTRRLAVASLLGLALFEIAMPFRHWLYPGNVQWTEEGYRFSWRMMLSEKIGFVNYRVVSEESGETWLVEPTQYLTPLQAQRMAIDPDMILQLAHRIAHDYRRRVDGEVRVMADAFVSFNGRANARLVDPDVDLSAARRGIAPKPWILPPLY